MGLFRIFSGKSPEAHEQRGDDCIKSGAFGDARIEYEKAVCKIEKHFPEKAHLASRLNEKILKANESLARTHLENANSLAEIGDFREARDLYALAGELTRDEALRAKIDARMASAHEDRVPSRKPLTEDLHLPHPEAVSDDIPDEFSDDSDDEIFSILCHALSPETEDAYRGYGDAFMRGYIALNRGEFKAAEKELTRALEENAGKHTQIPLELATACIHIKDYNRARGLLETVIAEHPGEVRACHLLCEIYWETRDYAHANRLLAEVPGELRKDLSILLLKGETRYQEQAFEAAELIFREAMTIHGSDEIVSRALAKTLEAKGETDAAREMYAEIINRCTSCQKAVDPFLKRRYAELCFNTGQYSTKLLDIYLGLTQEDPANRALYYRRIATIYKERGEMGESRRFDAFAENIR